MGNLLDSARAVWRDGLPPGSPAAFVFAVLCVAVATVIRYALDLIGFQSLMFAVYYPAILLSTLVAGISAGTIALVLGGLLGWSLFLSPNFETLPLAAQTSGLIAYAVASGIMIAIAEKYRQSLRQLAQEEQYRQIVADELGHRVRNKLATVQAILSHELRDNKEIWEKVSGRLRALSATDEFITRSDGQGAQLSEVLEAELDPYDRSRASLHGDPVQLPAKLAVMLALIFHELATNAAKHGALSTADGRVIITWHRIGARLYINWVESGARVRRPEHRGFGMRLLDRGLLPFDGQVKCKFEPSGLRCDISLIIPEPNHPAPLAGPRASVTAARPKSGNGRDTRPA
jgi:two-component sensor histidine kinase